jgi:hypothetical protein
MNESPLWLNWLFQYSTPESRDFEDNSIAFNIPLTLFFSLLRGMKKDDMTSIQIIVFYHPDEEELELDLWNTKFATSILDESKKEMTTIPCSYQAFTKQLQVLAKSAAKYWKTKAK